METKRQRSDPYVVPELARSLQGDRFDPAHYRKAWDTVDEVLALWARGMARHGTLAVPVAILLGARLVAVTLEACLSDAADTIAGGGC